MRIKASKVGDAEFEDTNKVDNFKELNQYTPYNTSGIQLFNSNSFECAEFYTSDEQFLSISIEDAELI